MQVRLENITKTFENKHKLVTAVNQLNVTISSGKLVGFLGPSGCGKTTSLFMVAGIHELTSGRIFFDEKDVTNMPADKRGVGMVFQNYALYPHLTVRDNIAFPIINSKEIKRRFKKMMDKEKDQTKQKISFKNFVNRHVEEAAKMVEITECLNRRPAELSGGQQQRVAIARAIVKQPNILLLDEPLSNLDARLRLQTRDEIKRIQQKTGITTIFVTHDQEESLSICDEIVVMKEGVLQQQGPPQQVYDYPENQFVAEFLGAPPINMLEAVVSEGWLLLCKKPWKPLPKPLPNGPVAVGLRAEMLRVCAPASQHALEAQVLSITKLGGATMVQVQQSDGTTLRLFQDMSTPVLPGQQVMLSVLENGTMVFDGQGGKLLQW